MVWIPNTRRVFYIILELVDGGGESICDVCGWRRVNTPSYTWYALEKIGDLAARCFIFEIKWWHVCQLVFCKGQV